MTKSVCLTLSSRETLLPPLDYVIEVMWLLRDRAFFPCAAWGRFQWALSSQRSFSGTLVFLPLDLSLMMKSFPSLKSL